MISRQEARPPAPGASMTQIQETSDCSLYCSWYKPPSTTTYRWWRPAGLSRVEASPLCLLVVLQPHSWAPRSCSAQKPERLPPTET